MSQEAKATMARRDGYVSLLRPWVTTLTMQAQGTLLCAIRGPDGFPNDNPVKAVVRALRATIVNNAKDVGPDDVFMGDGTGVCLEEDVNLFFDSVDEHHHHWYVHFVHAAEVVGYTHPNDEIRRFWNSFYERAVEDLHLSPETMDVMLERLRRDGALAEAGELGPCSVCGYGKLVHVLFTESLRTKLGGYAREHDRAGLCANCLIPRANR